MAKVSIASCPSVQDAELAVNTCLELLGWDAFHALVHEGVKVLVKPNVCGAKRPESGATTNPEVVAAIVKAVQKCGAQAIIGDGPAWGGGGNFFKVTRLDAVAAQLGVPLINLNYDQVVEKGLEDGVVFKSTRIAKTAIDADVIINVPVMKTSSACLYSGALKNMKGVLSGVEKHKPHIYGIDQGIVEVNRIVKQHLTIMDAIYGMEGDGPANGTPINLGLLLACYDPVALDAAAVTIMGFKPDEVPYIGMAEAAGLGVQAFEISGLPIDHVRRKCKPPLTYRNPIARFMINNVIFKRVFPFIDRVSKVKIDQKKCTYCGMCERACPVHAITIDKANKQYEIDHEKCIGCMCCHEVCLSGAPYLSRTTLRTMQRVMWKAKLGKSGLAEFKEK